LILGEEALQANLGGGLRTAKKFWLQLSSFSKKGETIHLKTFLMPLLNKIE
jgi:hypothetical protein